jgi:hypothetical protein
VSTVALPFAGDPSRFRSATLPSALWLGRIGGPVLIGIRTAGRCNLAGELEAQVRYRSRPDGAVRGFSFCRSVFAQRLLISFCLPPFRFG